MPPIMASPPRSSACPSCQPLYVVVNAGSGSSSDAVPPEKIISRVLSEAGRRHEILLVTAAENLDRAAHRAVGLARRNEGIVVAVGGDGTLNTVAQLALGGGCSFGVIPQGTFNYFGRAHDIPGDTAEAARALLTARIERVQVGWVNDRIFLVNASLGLYPESLEIREEQTERFGRSRLVAAWAAFITVMRGFRPMLVKLEGPGGTHELRTLTLFVGNNRLQLERMGAAAEDVESGRLGAVVLRPVSKLGLLWLAALGVAGRLGRAHEIESFTTQKLTVSPSRPRARSLKVAIDGEIAWMNAPIEFRVSPEPLLLLKPAPAKGNGRSATR
jgi:diacylglycerol kinase family enzyme